MTEEANLERLRERSRTANIAVGRLRDEVVRCIRESGEVRIAAALEPESSSPKDIEARCKKLDAQRNAAQAEIDRLIADVDAFDTAIARIEADLLPKLHAERLEMQRQIRDRYRSMARRIVDAANLLRDVSLEASALYNSTEREFPKEESAKGLETVTRCAGLKEIWDPNWIHRYGNPTLRDVVIGAVFDWDRSLVNESDPVSILKRSQEESWRVLREEGEHWRRLRLIAAGIEPADANEAERDSAEADAAARARGESVSYISHPLSRVGLLRQFGKWASE